MENKITIICGHYGCGKTNLSLNLAINSAKCGEPTVLVDMDVVNPYFRSCEYKELLTENGVEMISPTMSDSTLDLPAISSAVYSVFRDEGKTVIIDLGGDDVGATALGMFKDNIKNYEMIYVINKNRLQSSESAGAIELLREIETATGLKATAIVNNSHMGTQTTKEILIESLLYAKVISDKLGLPLLYSTAPSFCELDGFVTVERYVKFVWE